jgi:hypothetical protein
MRYRASRIVLGFKLGDGFDWYRRIKALKAKVGQIVPEVGSAQAMAHPYKIARCPFSEYSPDHRRETANSAADCARW